MLVRYVNIEEVDDVLTLTIAEHVKEEGFLLHIMRVSPDASVDGFDPELEDYELATRDRLCDGGVHDWSFEGSTLTLNLTDEAADHLGIERVQVFELDIPGDDLDRIREVLRIALSPIGFLQRD